MRSFGDILAPSCKFWKKVAHARGLDPRNAHFHMQKTHRTFNSLHCEDKVFLKQKDTKCPAQHHCRVNIAIRRQLRRIARGRTARKRKKRH